MSENAPTRPTAPNEQQIIAWLEYEYAEAAERAKELSDALNSILAKHPDGLPDQQVADIVAHNLSLVGDFAKPIDDQRKAETKPYRDLHATINRWFEQHVTDQLIDPQDKVKKLQTDWRAEQRRKVLEEARLHRERAAAEARRAAEAAARAIEESRPDVAKTVEQAAQAAAELDQALSSTTNSAISEQTRRRSAYGTTSYDVVRWKAKLVDFTALSDYYKTVDWPRVNDAMRTRDLDGSKTGIKGKPTAVIPGIEWVEDFSIGNR